MQGRAEQQIAALAASIKAAIQDEQAARQKRHSFTLEAVSDMGTAHSCHICRITLADRPFMSCCVNRVATGAPARIQQQSNFDLPCCLYTL